MPLKKYWERIDSLKKGIIATTVILMIMLTACGGGKHSDYSKIYESYGNIQSYSADIEVTVITGDSERTYTATQYYAAPDLYRIDYTSEEMEGISCVLSGDKLSYKGPGGEVTEFEDYIPGEKYYIFMTDFMERYCKSEEAQNTAKRGRTILHLEENGDNPHRASMELWIKNKTGLPEKMITYNDKGEERVIVKFENFKMNEGIDKKVFDL